MQNITVKQKVGFSVVGVDQFGADFPLPADAKYAWSNDDPTVATLAPVDQASGVATAVDNATQDQRPTDVKIVVTVANGDTFTAVDTLVVGPAEQSKLAGVALRWGTPEPK
jgi:hypothetical protein